MGAIESGDPTQETDGLRVTDFDSTDATAAETNGAADPAAIAEAAEGTPAPEAGPARLFDLRLDLEPVHVEECIAKRGLLFSNTLVAQICAALSSGKHLLLVGPPGTGKTEIARALGEAAERAGYCNGTFVATASADWSTFDTIGGYAMEKNSQFVFRSGVFLRAIEMKKWLVLDEVNRGDIDRSFGELMTVLAGGHTDTPYTQPNGKAISIGPGEGYSHRVPATFRVLATMNTWDKTSLFRLSYAVQRRFAVVYVGPPADATYANIIDAEAVVDRDVVPSLERDAVERMKRLFRTDGLLVHRAIGPAIARDMVHYQRRRKVAGDGFAEALALFLLPQLEGLDADRAKRVFTLLSAVLEGWAGDDAWADFRARFADLFPTVDTSK